MDDILIAHGATLLFVAVTALPWLLERNRQVFQPIKLWSALHIALVVPAAVLVTYHPDYLHRDVCIHCQSGPVRALTETLLVFSLLHGMILAGYYALTWRLRRRLATASTPILPQPHDHGFILMMLLMAGIAGFLFKLASAGGLGFVQDNLNQRAALQAGLGPLNFLIEVAFILAAILALRRYALMQKDANLMILGIVLLLGIGTATLFGGRKASLQLVLTALMLYALYRPGFMPMSLRTLPSLIGIYALVMLYFGAVLLYRSAGDAGQSTAGLPDILGQIALSFAEMLLSMSYLDHYIFIVSAFDADTFYYGATFKDLATGFIPSGWMPDKPAVDDGLYVRVATLGGRLEPGTPAHLLAGLASWPGETLGTAYMNGGVALVLVFGLLQGLAMGIAYRMVANSANSLLWPLLLCHVMLNFKISNLRITNLVATLVAALLIILIIRILSLFTARTKA